VRHGIAIAGLAGGFWLLGQAVANADDAVNTASATGAQTASTPAGGGGGADSTTKQSVAASNTNTNTASTGKIDASGGSSHVDVNAGNGNTVLAGSGKGDTTASQNVTTVVWISSEANGGTVSGSNNAAAGNGASNTATANATQNSTTTGGSGKNGGDAESTTRQHVNASNYNDNYASTGKIDASGGTSHVDVDAGNGNDVLAGSGNGPNMNTYEGGCNSGPVVTSQQGNYNDNNCRHEHGKRDDSGGVHAAQTIGTKVTISSEANGGRVSDSNNSAAGNGAHNTATANGTQNSTTTGGTGQNGKEDSHTKGDDWWKNHGGNADSNTHQDVDSSNTNDNTATTGKIDVSGGHSTVDVSAGNGNTLYCTSKSGNVTCSQSITTIINIISQANGGSVSCSNNASAGNSGSAVCPVTKNNTTPAPAAAPAAHKAVAPAAKKAAASASAQPKGTLAFTGAETSLPLTLGLLALGAGGALTLAGRRRETTTV
jgi:hypothetical protein